MTMTKQALHVSNGDATGLRGTGIAGTIMLWRDALHEGPVPAVPDASCARIRAAFLAGADADDRGEGEAEFAERDRTLEADRDGEYVLWFEADLYDQLQIMQILARLAELGRAGRPDHADLHRRASRHRPLRRSRRADRRPARRLPAQACARLTPAALELAARAWAALRAPDPRGLGEIAAHGARLSCASWARRSTGSAASTRPPATACR